MYSIVLGEIMFGTIETVLNKNFQYDSCRLQFISFLNIFPDFQLTVYGGGDGSNCRQFLYPSDQS